MIFLAWAVFSASIGLNAYFLLFQTRERSEPSEDVLEPSLPDDRGFMEKALTQASMRSQAS